VVMPGRGRRVDAEIATLAEAQHGVVGREQLRDLGIERSGIDSRVRRGALLPLHRGVYAVGHCRLTNEGRWMAAVLASGPGGVLSHRSAGQLWQVLSSSPAIPEVTRPRSFRTRGRIRCHQAILPADEIDEVEGIPVTSVSRTLLDLGSILSAQQLERAFNEAEIRQLRSRRSVPDLLGRYAGRRGSTALRRLLAEDATSRGVTKRELEARFAGFLDAHGLPSPRRNADLAVRGRFFNVDCLWPRERLIVELDGRAVHGTRRAFEADRERDRLLLVEGWRVARVTWAQLAGDPRGLATDLRALLGGAGASTLTK
jgi:Transcriptional regulator, AbiEi antitoxin/Protein of unknown function (DUF559)